MIHKWWHKIIRRNTKPIPEDVAILWKRRLSYAYGFLAWNAFGILLLSMYKGKADWANYYGLTSDEEAKKSPALGWANTLGIQNAKVYRVSGFRKVDEYDIVDGQKVKPEEKKQKHSEELEQ